MRYTEFVREVEARAAGGLDQEQAERAIRATLAMLAERVSAKEVSDLAAQLPKELRTLLEEARREGGPLRSKEFLHRIADREGVSPSEAFDRTRAVLDVLIDAVTAGELEDVLAELPEDFETLFKRPATRAWPDEHVSPVHSQRGRVAGQVDPE